MYCMLWSWRQKHSSIGKGSMACSWYNYHAIMQWNKRHMWITQKQHNKIQQKLPPTMSQITLHANTKLHRLSYTVFVEPMYLNNLQITFLVKCANCLSTSWIFRSELLRTWSVTLLVYYFNVSKSFRDCVIIPVNWRDIWTRLPNN